MSLQTGKILQGRYPITSHIGQGGMGTVYQAKDTRLNNRLVAVKEFDSAQLPLADRQIALQAFQQEAVILAGLSHPGLTAVYDYFLENNKFYLVMEFVRGETLQQAWERGLTVAGKTAVYPPKQNGKKPLAAQMILGSILGETATAKIGQTSVIVAVQSRGEMTS